MDAKTKKELVRRARYAARQTAIVTIIAIMAFVVIKVAISMYL